MRTAPRSSRKLTRLRRNDLRRKCISYNAIIIGRELGRRKYKEKFNILQP